MTPYILEAEVLAAGGSQIEHILLNLRKVNGKPKRI